MKSTRQPRKTGRDRRAFAERLRAEYYAGASIRNLAERTGYSYGTVRNLLLSVKTKLRKRGGGRPRPRTGQGQ
ncbi:helix-turn-helix domain-containing protein [Streptomyces mirabilis]|uniref:helix-turn-helix domain-containing protein n=1 Tax=Streptomyces mirabilis TaxID=68239 RepID=UPI002255F060|nr:helix-turn-helix domain-containing protein [Streptomyces mirabilis]MCX4609489.1 helix-turn-helix domain-containing protein [Streptomyces mirabilis]